jgi:hypothetical protein
MGALFWPSGMLWCIEGVLALLSWDAEWTLEGRDGVGDVTWAPETPKEPKYGVGGQGI